MRSVKSICLLVVALFALSCSSKTMAGTYACDRERTPKDTLDLKADGTFVLQEDGATLTGTWSQTATGIDVDIRGGGKASMRIDGKDLIDSASEVGRWIRE